MKDTNLKKNKKNEDAGLVLVVDDVVDTATIIKKLLELEGFRVITAYDGKNALKKAINEKPDAILLDIKLPDIDGIELLKKIKEHLPDVSIVMFTAYASVETVIQSLQDGAIDFIQKPFENEYLLYSIRKAVEKKRLHDQIKKNREEIEATKNYLENVIESSGDPILIVDAKGYLVKMNKMAEEILGYSASEIKDKQIYFLYPYDEELHNMLKILRKKGYVSQYEINIRNKKGEIIPFELSIRVLRDHNNKLIGSVTIARDLRERKRLEEELRYKSITDELTDLYNRRHFYEQLEQEITRAKRMKTNLSLILFDIDDFKYYNDTFGHLEGDRILKKVGEITKKNIRGKVDTAYRYGGDEFTILLPGADQKQAITIANRIVSSLKKSELHYINLSMGIVEYKNKYSLEEFVKHADEAMYKAKQTCSIINVYNHKKNGQNR
ncbi:MAG: hypothetical protein DRG20_05800 [Deltaproteobacteria bacterium]|nr:diguanylate cyclase [Deltaproteobacteria bacterium]RLA88659.1 MAG: hypothetical protein DRG20_05800 [Deltaproteobacteria bacterium]